MILQTGCFVEKFGTILATGGSAPCVKSAFALETGVFRGLSGRGGLSMSGNIFVVGCICY